MSAVISELFDSFVVRLVVKVATHSTWVEDALLAPEDIWMVLDLLDRNAVERNHTFTFFCAL